MGLQGTFPDCEWMASTDWTIKVAHLTSRDPMVNASASFTISVTDFTLLLPP